MAKTLEQKIVEQERKIGLLERQLVDAVWVLDLETMKYTYISSSVEQLRGYTPEETMAVTIKEILTPNSYDRVISVLLSALDEFERGNDPKETMELEMYHKDGSTLWVEITAKLLKENGEKVKVVGTSKDISARKQSEFERENLIRQLEDALAEQKRLQEENRVLRGLLPICSECKKIRDEDGKWWPVDQYIASRTEANFTHTICPDCSRKLYPDFHNRRA